MQKLLNKKFCMGVAGMMFATFLTMPSARAADTCGVNLFNPQLLTEADFTANGNTYKDGKWNGYLNEYVSHYPFEFIPGKSYKLVYKINCDTEEAGRGALAFVMQGGTVKGPTTNVCQGQSGTQVVTFTSGEGTIVGMTIKAVSGNELPKASVTLSDVMVVLDGVSTSDFIAYNPCISIATGNSLLQRVTGVKNRLTSVNGIIDSLIAQSDTNTTNVGGLQTDKQTRPATLCPAGKQCLLVKNEDNTNDWYEIVDCVGDTFFADVGTDAPFAGITNAADDGQNCGGYKDGSTAHRACAETGANCGNDQWMRSFTNGAVYGDAIRLTVAEPVGAIVTLPAGTQNDTSGTKCLCRATGYRVRTDNEYGNLVSLSSNDKWYVKGIASDSHSCQYNCANDGDTQSGNGVDMPYYAALGLSNVCASTASEARMCLASDFLASIANHNVSYTGANSDNEWGWVKENGTKMGLCNSLNDCGSAGSHAWVEKYGSGYVYGRAKLANIEEYDFRYEPGAPGLIKLTGTEEERGICLCQVTGYKTSSSATKQEYANDLWMIISGYEQGDFGTSYDSSDGWACTKSCARYFGSIAYDAGYYAAIDDLCVDDLSGIPTATPVTCDDTYLTACTNSGGWWTSRTCSCSCGTGKVLDNTTHACVCDAANGYYNNNGTCEQCDTANHFVVNNAGTGCTCDDGYVLQNGQCVEEEQQQSCESESGMALKKQNCQHSGGTWNSDNCTCNCSSKPHSTLNNEGWCACDTGYQADGNYTCVSTDNGCEQITSIIEPGNLIENGEALFVNGYLGGGKACDGRIAGIPDATNAYDPQHSCHENEWVHAYENVAIFGEARMVAINEDTPGDIIQLPNNVQDVNAGGVCVCRATAYANANGNTGSGYLSGTMYDPRVSINTGNKWIIAGRQVSYNEEYTGVQNCITNCAFYTPTSLVEYYDYIGNGCTNVTGTTATACLVANPETTTSDPYMTFVNAAVGQKWMTNPTIGFAAVSKTGKGTGFCENNNSAYCQAAEGDLTAWAMQVTITDPNKYFNTLGEQVSNPYNGQVVLYGRARCVDNSGELAKLQYNQGTLVDLTEVPSNSERGTVCIQNIAGYMRGEKQTTTLRSSYWYATKFESAGACAESCAATTAQEMMTEIGELSEPIGGLCLNNEE